MKKTYNVIVAGIYSERLPAHPYHSILNEWVQYSGIIVNANNKKQAKEIATLNYSEVWSVSCRIMLFDTAMLICKDAIMKIKRITTKKNNDMKTVEEAARDYAIHEYWGICEIVDCEAMTDKSEEDFKAGVEFAQRWISVEEELPEPMKQVIVKLENGWCTCTWLMNDGEFAFNVHPTYWRPIDLK